MHTKNIVAAGKPLTENQRVLIMLHGRGGSAEDILSLSAHLHVPDFTLLAPQAANSSWYPYSFLAAPGRNEPWLSSALQLLKELVEELESKGVPPGNLYFVGFSQGACLALEFVGRNASRYGGVVAFTGGFIGDKIYKENYTGDFAGTPIFIGTGHPDAHVPVERVHETTQVLEEMHAEVVEKVYPQMGHTINQDEIETANKLVFSRSA